MHIDDNIRAVRKARKIIPLTEAEYAVLVALLRAKGCVTRDQLLSAIGGAKYMPTTRTVDQHISRLRKKLGKRAIKTIHGMGYIIMEKE